MTTTPDDIMAAARKIADEINASIDPIEAVEAAIAEALLAERERCAKIAERYGAERAGAGDGQTYILRDVNGLDIANAIRSQS